MSFIIKDTQIRKNIITKVPNGGIQEELITNTDPKISTCDQLRPTSLLILETTQYTLSSGL